MRKVPKLRFKEFSDEWEEKKLGDIIINISSGKTLKKLNEGNFNLYGSTGKIGFTNNADYYGENILIARVGSNAGTLSFINEECGITDNTLVTSVKNNNYNKWLYYFLINYNLNKLIFGSGQPLITGSLVKKICLNIPLLEEQEKIANFLSNVDKKISLTEEKLELFKEYKKGVMQKIFSQELRFKDNDGNDYPEWEEKRFDEVYVVISNKEFQIKNSEILNIGKYKVIDQGKEKIAGYSNSELKLFKNIPIIVYGDHTTNIKFIDFNFILGGDGTKLLTTKEQRNLKFLYFALDNYNITPEGYKRHFSILKEIKLYIPSSLEEQKKIADFLSSIDTKIENIEKELENLKEFKKGLLQQMFV